MADTALRTRALKRTLDRTLDELDALVSTTHDDTKPERERVMAAALADATLREVSYWREQLAEALALFPAGNPAREA